MACSPSFAWLDFFHGSLADWENARRIVNGTDRAAEFGAIWARAYWAMILARIACPMRRQFQICRICHDADWREEQMPPPIAIAIIVLATLAMFAIAYFKA